MGSVPLVNAQSGCRLANQAGAGRVVECFFRGQKSGDPYTQTEREGYRGDGDPNHFLSYQRARNPDNVGSGGDVALEQSVG